MTTVEEVRQAIRQLSRFERDDLAEWLLNSADVAAGVAEPAVAYAEPHESRWMSVEEYLRMEVGSPVKHEYVAGKIFAMSGVTLRHAAIADDLVKNLNDSLQKGPCRAFSSDVKVRFQVGRDEIFYYPDVVVACDLDFDSNYLTHPRLVVEVLSPSTEKIDRTEKALNYRHIASLEEYVLIAQRPMQVTVLRRREDWIPEVLTSPEAVVEFRSVGLSLTVERIYASAR